MAPSQPLFYPTLNSDPDFVLSSCTTLLPALSNQTMVLSPPILTCGTKDRWWDRLPLGSLSAAHGMLPLPGSSSGPLLLPKAACRQVPGVQSQRQAQQVTQCPLLSATGHLKCPTDAQNPQMHPGTGASAGLSRKLTFTPSSSCSLWCP